MSVFKRGGKWWYEFTVRGIRIRETSGTHLKGVCQEIERVRRDELLRTMNGLPQKADSKPKKFPAAAREFLEDQEAHYAKKTKIMHKNSLAHLELYFGKHTLHEIVHKDIAFYQRARLKQGASNRSVNIEISLLRLVLRKNRQWSRLQEDVRMLPERHDVGRELSDDEIHRLLAKARAGTSRSLYPAVFISMHTGLRNRELRLLRWHQVDLLEKTVTVGKSKTAGGEGRIIPLSEPATRCLQDWRSQFPDALPSDAVFPSEKYGLIGKKGSFGGRGAPYQVLPNEPIGSWNSSWTRAREEAGVECRWHDLRHSLWMSPKMIERYSHVRNEAKRNAILVLNSLENRGTHNFPHKEM